MVLLQSVYPFVVYVYHLCYPYHDHFPVRSSETETEKHEEA
jgi:hypothetical protein